MRIAFSVSRWAAWAPNLTTEADWRAWAKAPAVPRGPEVPPLAEVPPMTRRRIERLGRLAYQVAQWCEGDTKGLPLVFASRHGDTQRSVELLTELARGEPLSPTSFGLSVHNAVVAQFAMARKDTAPASAIANGRFTPEAGALEAVAMVGEGHEAALLVMYDAHLPDAYAPFLDEPEADYAWAWLVTQATHGPQLTLERLEAPDADAPSTLPHGLEVLRFFLGEARELSRGGWRWTRHA